MTLTAHELDAHVGRRMKLRRELMGISQARLARHLGLTFSQVQKYEKGMNRIGAGRLYLLAEFLKVPVGFFFQDLGEAGSVRAVNGRAHRDSELAALDDAFLSIADRDTRQTLLALVCSVAASDARTSQDLSRA